MVVAKSSRASVVILVIIVVAAIIVSVAAYYFFFNNGEPPDDGSEDDFSSPSPEILGQPLPKILSEKGTRSFTPYDTYTVEVVVKNNGGDGFIKVFAEINAFGEDMEKSERIFLEHTAQRGVEFVFNLDPWTKTPSAPEDPNSIPYPTQVPYPTDYVYPSPIPPTPTPTPAPITYSTWALAD